MTKIRPFSDERLLPECVYCGEHTFNRDHIPAKVFLEQPYPANLNVLNSCLSCNEDASLDEQYVATIIEIAKIGSLEPSELRSTISSTLLGTKNILTMLKTKVTFADEGFKVGFDEDRVKKILIKLARGHAAYDLSEFTFELEPQIQFSELNNLSMWDREQFELSPILEIYPEVGSRAMQRFAESNEIAWVTIQSNLYRYMAYADMNGIYVRKD